MGLVFIFAMMGLGLNIVVGFAGLLDLGYVAFFAIGAYVYAFISAPSSSQAITNMLVSIGMSPASPIMSFWMAIPFTMAAAGLGGVLLGIPVLRMRGDYLAIVTLGFWRDHPPLHAQPGSADQWAARHAQHCAAGALRL